MYKTDKSKTGFTLAEVLITIVIIGIVSALTIPSVIVNYEKRTMATKLKVLYRTLNKAANMSVAKNGQINTWDIQNTTWGSSTYNAGKEFFDKYLQPYLIITRTCKHKSKECWAEKYIHTDNSQNSFFSANNNNTYSMVLNNGTVIGFWPEGDFVEVYCDLNGKKGPNKFGKDAFILTIVKNSINKNDIGKIDKPGVYIYGQGYTRADYTGKTNRCGFCPCTKNKQGHWCGALIMSDGWEIKDDYPW